MPGAPNRPPEVAAAPAAPPPPAGDPSAKVLRRLVPSHVALLLDSWKGGAPPEVLAPFEKAEAALLAGDAAGATGALDLLSIRFAEPRWPSLAEPFRRLRVAIPAPMPPQWDPEHALAAPEKELRRARRTADDQLLLAEGCVAWAREHGIDTAGFAPALVVARQALAGEGLPPEFYAALDPVWATLRGRLPRPKAAGRAAVAAAADDG